MQEDKLIKKGDENKKRGVLLTILLTVSALGIISTLPTLNNQELIKRSYVSIPSWFLLYEIFGLSLGIVNLYGIWTWRKWSIFTLAFSIILAFIMQLLILEPANQIPDIIRVFYLIMGAVLWSIAIYRKWKYFK
jgi:hypothetical protein